MKRGFEREDSLFSLCGLNCGLCPMKLRGGCGGCFTDSPCYPTCPIAPCSVAHGHVEYCFECPEYPCKRYDGIDAHDSLISHRNQKADLTKAKRMGIEAYLAEQREKVELLHRLLEKYDDGHRDVFFCLAANLLDVEDLKGVLDEAEREHAKTQKVVDLLYHCAEARGIPLALRR